MTKSQIAYFLYRSVLLLVSLIAVLIGLSSYESNGYSGLWTIPAVYFILSITTLRLNKYYKKHIGLLLVDVFIFIKYALGPLLILLMNDFSIAGYTGVTPAAESIHQAIQISILEMIGLFVIIHIFSPIFYKKIKTNTPYKFRRINMSPMLLVLSITALLLAVIFDNYFIPSSILFVSDEYTGMSGESIAFSGLVIMLAQAIKLIAMMLVVNEMLYRYQKNSKWRYAIIAYLTLIIYIALSTGTSRTGMLIPFIIFIIITYPIFKRKSLAVLLITTPILVGSLISVTAFKAPWLVEDNTSAHSTTEAAIRQTQEYTANIRPIALGVEAMEKNKENIRPELFYNDIVGSIPLLNSPINQEERINVYYNDYILDKGLDNTSQIMPMTSISVAYFGKFFAWILSATCIIVAMAIDSRRKREFYPQRYLQIYLIYIFAFGIFSNTQMVAGRFFTIFLPTAIIIFLILKFNTSRTIQQNAYQ